MTDNEVDKHRLGTNILWTFLIKCEKRHIYILFEFQQNRWLWPNE